MTESLFVGFRGVMAAFRKLHRQDVARYNQTGTLSQGNVAAQNKIWGGQDKAYTLEVSNLYCAMVNTLTTMSRQPIYRQE